MPADGRAIAAPKVALTGVVAIATNGATRKAVNFL
jgi:hypothetical protein